MTSLATRLKGLTLIVILIVLALALITGVANREENELGGAAVGQVGGGEAVHASLGIAAFFLVLGHIALNHRSAVLHTKRIFATDTKGAGSVPRLRGLISLLLLVSLAL
ncbi:MAG: hypothetical protein LUO79_04350, partial [Methanomassiliicoccales archaeon]|nr:hypothetical protein [Methanomassiliicoccales archaeon]